jgi:Mrp family chromosome partitioning ATPase
MATLGKRDVETDQATGTPVPPPKMVVGRKALRTLAASSAASSPRAAIGAATTPPSADQAIDDAELTRTAISISALEEQEIVELSAVPRAPAARRYRVDRQKSAELQHAVTSSAHASEEAYEDRQEVTATVVQRPAQQNPGPVRAELEVDRLSWPPICEKLISARRRDLNLVVETIEKQSSAGGQLIAVASAESRDGCTTVLLCLARLLADRNRSVCVLDANTARPGLASQLGLCPEVGWERAASRRASLAETLIESQADRVTVLPLISTQSADCLSQLESEGIVAALRTTFDVVLIDIGAIVGSNMSESSAATKLADACLLVKNESSSARGAQQACALLEECNIPLIGLIENRCRM